MDERQKKKETSQGKMDKKGKIYCPILQEEVEIKDFCIYCIIVDCRKV